MQPLSKAQFYSEACVLYFYRYQILDLFRVLKCRNPFYQPLDRPDQNNKYEKLTLFARDSFLI